MEFEDLALETDPGLSAHPIDQHEIYQLKNANIISGFQDLLLQATRLRVGTIAPSGDPANADLAIMFSGGLDCILLAAFAHQTLPIDQSIDLLNVAFENPRIQKCHNHENPYDVPDRITGKLGYAELVKLCPRPWRFVEIDVPYTKVGEFRSHIQNVMKPLETVMDFSIAMAFWFVAGGVGTVDNVKYISKAKILLSGLGADEQLGGYSRHAVAFKTSGWEGLLKQLQLDTDRIGQRNLGRDDRIVADVQLNLYSMGKKFAFHISTNLLYHSWPILLCTSKLIHGLARAWATNFY